MSVKARTGDAVAGLIEPDLVVGLTREDAVVLGGHPLARQALLSVWREISLRNGYSSLPPRLIPALDALAEATAPRASADASASPPRFGDLPPDRTQWITTREAAKLINISDRSVRDACKAGRLVARPSGKGWRVDAADAVRYRDQRDVGLVDTRAGDEPAVHAPPREGPWSPAAA